MKMIKQICSLFLVSFLFICLSSQLNNSYVVSGEEPETEEASENEQEKEEKDNPLSGLLSVLLGGTLTLAGSIYATRSGNKQAEIKFKLDDLEKDYEFKKNAYFSFLDCAKKAGAYITETAEQKLDGELSKELSHQLIWIELSADEYIYQPAKQLFDYLTNEGVQKSEEDFLIYYDALRTAMRNDLMKSKASKALR